MPVLVGVGASLACDGAELPRDTIAEPNTASLVLQSSIGEDEFRSPEAQFSAIVAMLVTDDGKLWVVDGHNGPTPQVRIFDEDGRFLQQVGNAGSGPGEYRNPNALGLLSDGRVVLRDMNLADRLTVYKPDGAFDTTWYLGGKVASVGSAPRLVVDTSGLVWVSIGSPAEQIPFVGYLRIRNGLIVDTVLPPPLPDVAWEGVSITKNLRSGGRSVRGVGAPFRARAVWALDRLGRFAIARTDEYRIEILPSYGADDGSPSSIVSREVGTVSISEAQRADERERLIKIMRATGVPTRHVPKVPTRKPPIKQLFFSSDSQLLVSVSSPSRFVDGAWVESNAYDVFDQNHRFRGRVYIPDRFTIGYLKSDKLWGVWRDDYGVESVRRYNTRWPESQASFGPRNHSRFAVLGSLKLRERFSQEMLAFETLTQGRRGHESPPSSEEPPPVDDHVEWFVRGVDHARN